MWIDSSWEDFETKITTPAEKIVQEACSKQKEALPASLESALEKGIEITDNNQFERLKTMLEKYSKINLWKMTFQDLNWGIWVFIKREQGNPSYLWVYNLNNLKIYGTNLVKLWVIKNSEFDGYNWFYKFIIAPRESRQQDIDYSIPKEENCDKPQIDNSTTTPEVIWESIPSEIITPLEDKEHTIQKWENLWKIIEKSYNFPDQKTKNRDIANTIAKVLKDPKNKAIDKGDGKIFIGDTLHLPYSLELTYRDKTTKTISMKK